MEHAHSPQKSPREQDSPGYPREEGINPPSKAPPPWESGEALTIRPGHALRLHESQATIVMEEEEHFEISTENKDEVKNIVNKEENIAKKDLNKEN